ncbi:MAG: sulfatase-like hydrolase/transferase [Kiritimatiellae bacterium]|nr:sulfatase-like hydrolase/transferase [Kiritimatiellia bacterium]
MSEKPNIIFFFVDQQRWDTCGCYGQPLDVTPNLDKMAKDGVLFKDAFTCQPVCGPARACLQTGKYATEIGCHTNNKMLPLEEKTIAKILNRNGYETGYIGKWHLASFGEHDGPDDFRTKPVPEERRGGYKDYWLASDVLEFTSHGYGGHMFDADGNKKEFPEGRFRADAQTDWVLDYLDTRSLDKPFFLFTSYIEPHHQNDHNCYEGPNGSKEKYADFVAPKDLIPGQGDWEANYPDYLGCINSLDMNLGRIRKKVEELGIADNTVIIYTSDHGSHFKVREGEYKRNCHDACAKVPMVIYGAEFVGGKVVDDKLVNLIDLPRTIMDVAAIPVEEYDYMRGRTLSEAIKDCDDWEQESFMQISETKCARAIRTKRWTYCVRGDFPEGWTMQSSADVYYEEFLYDNLADPDQLNNLVKSPEHEDVRAELAVALKRRILDAEGASPEILPAK